MNVQRTKELRFLDIQNDNEWNKLTVCFDADLLTLGFIIRYSKDEFMIGCGEIGNLYSDLSAHYSRCYYDGVTKKSNYASDY